MQRRNMRAAKQNPLSPIPPPLSFHTCNILLVCTPRCGRRGGLMVSALVSGSSDALASGPGGVEILPLNTTL